MILLVVLALLALGAVLGAAGMRRLGRWAARLRSQGQWRLGVGGGALVVVLAGLALVARGAWLFGLLAFALATTMALAARRRPAQSSPTAAGMSLAEARSILGVGTDASPAEIQAAYLRLMRLVHPDRGGAVGLASQLNAARASLLG